MRATRGLPVSPSRPWLSPALPVLTSASSQILAGPSSRRARRRRERDRRGRARRGRDRRGRARRGRDRQADTTVSSRPEMPARSLRTRPRCGRVASAPPSREHPPRLGEEARALTDRVPGHQHLLVSGQMAAPTPEGHCGCVASRVLQNSCFTDFSEARFPVWVW